MDLWDRFVLSQVGRGSFPEVNVRALRAPEQRALGLCALELCALELCAPELRAPELHASGHPTNIAPMMRTMPTKALAETGSWKIRMPTSEPTTGSMATTMAAVDGCSSFKAAV